MPNLGPMEMILVAVVLLPVIMVFCVVFGLSMDYEVFLVARIAEAVIHRRSMLLSRPGHPLRRWP